MPKKHKDRVLKFLKKTRTTGVKSYVFGKVWHIAKITALRSIDNDEFVPAECGVYFAPKKRNHEWPMCKECQSLFKEQQTSGGWRQQLKKAPKITRIDEQSMPLPAGLPE